MTNTSGRDVQTRSAESEQSGTREMITECSTQEALTSAIISLVDSASVVARWYPCISESHERAIVAAREALAAIDANQDGFHKLMTREEYGALKIVGWHSVCHNFRGETGATAVRYHSPARYPRQAMLTARALVENHITHFGMVPHPDCLKEAIAEAIATSSATAVRYQATEGPLSKAPSADGSASFCESSLNPSSLNQPEPPHDS